MEVINHLRIESTELLSGHTYANCTCLLCGNVCQKKLSMIKIGHIKSCGCLGKSKRFKKDRGNIPTNFMSDFTSESVNYWGGFLFGDGSVDVNSKLQVCLTNKHNVTEHLQKLSVLLLNKSIVRLYTNRCHLQITSLELCNNLLKFGIIPNKTYNSCLQIPNINMVKHVIRGYFDADGWFSKTTYKNKYIKYVLGICSYLPENLEQIQQYLPCKTNIKKYNRSNQLYHLTIQNKQDIYDVTKYLYGEPCLPYKWNKIKTFWNDYKV